VHRIAWILGAIGLPLSHYWLVARVEPFFSLIYIFLWWSYIFVADFLVFKLRGKSMLSDRPWEFVVIWWWSIPAWLLFEVVNRRIENWYYVMAPVSLTVGIAYLLFAFGAVLPGIFVTMELIVGLIEKFAPIGKISGPPFVPDRRHIGIQMVIGVAMLALVLVFPKSCFAMTWGFVFFFVDPLCFRLWRSEPNHVGKSLLGQLAAGDNTRFVALLVGGFICGGLWEGWNINARTKWIYSVPFFDELKLGEMPILGFLGFPPFALECYAMVNLLSYFRGGRSWELSGADNRALRGMSKRGMVACTFVLPLAILIACFMTLKSVASFAEPLNWHFRNELGKDGIAALRERNALQAHEFLKLKERPRQIDEALWTRMQRIASMAEFKGMGLEKALLLEKLGIASFEELARQEPSNLVERMRELGGSVRNEEIKVWIRAARKV
jgi:hypothetical protein